MQTEELYEERLNVRIPKKLNDALNTWIPRGIKGEVIRLILESLVREFEEKGKSLVGDILAEKYTIKMERGHVTVDRK